MIQRCSYSWVSTEISYYRWFSDKLLFTTDLSEPDFWSSRNKMWVLRPYHLVSDLIPQAYQDWTRNNSKELKLPGLDFTPEQLFFLRFAQVWVIHLLRKERFFSLRSKVMKPSWVPKGCHVSRTHVSPSLVKNRELKQKRRRRRRRSKRLIKMSSRFSNLNLSVGSEYFWSWILNDSSKLRKRKENHELRSFLKS